MSHAYSVGRLALIRWQEFQNPIPCSMQKATSRNKKLQPAARVTTLRILSIAASLVLGLFLIISGLGKLMNVNAFLETVRSYGIPYRLAYGAALIPPVEILLGLGFILRTWTRHLALLTSLMLGLFTIAFAYGYFIEGVEDCGCFGELAFFQVAPSTFFLRNGVLLLGSIFLWLYPTKEFLPPYRPALLLGLGVLGAILFTAAGISSVQPIYQEAPEAAGDDFNNRLVAETPLAPFLSAARDSTYLVFVYSTTCAHCWNSVENVKAFQRIKAVDRVLGLTVASDSALAAFEQRAGSNFKTKRIEAADLQTIARGVPFTLFIEHGYVRNVWSGGVPAPYLFERNSTP